MEKKLNKILVIGILFLFLGASATLASANFVWSDNFDTYANDQFLDGGADDGGWNGWGYAPAAGAYVRDDYSFSSPYSVEIVGATDLVHEYSGYTEGVWIYKAMQYIPEDFTGISYFILLSGYDGGGSGTVWVVQVHFDASLNEVGSEFNGETAPLVKGTWVEIKCVIDLTTDWLQIWYNGALLAEHAYTDTVQGTGGGALNIAAVDLFANTGSPVYYDDISLTSPSPDLQCDAGGPYSGEVNQNIQFTGFATGGTAPYTWAWNFGDGGTATTQSPTHAYTTAGTYTATLTVTDADATVVTDNATVTVVAPQPVLEIGAITGGFGIKSSVKNTGEGAATNVEWAIELDGKLIFVGKSTTGTVATLAPGNDEPIKAGFILGFGKTNIEVTASCGEGVSDTATASAFVLGPFVLGVK